MAVLIAQRSGKQSARSGVVDEKAALKRAKSRNCNEKDDSGELPQDDRLGGWRADGESSDVTFVSHDYMAQD
ncbi:hypothetical protein TcasGA2_TC000344 [Tribolium castaneum]|uniref:Uncharacterized protein n=1 Tax=Tribolium castaneum TaxID=7070 RepID=D6WAT6_TRICA|nr:hypothetical protein TcasGA2_TC000344 [Tribolium castaneum]